MPVTITMPRLSDTMQEGTLVSWKVKVGDKISAGDHLADVETDKATMELQAFDDGTVARLMIEEGDTVPIETAIAVLAEDGESVEEASKAAGSAPAKPAQKQETAEPEAKEKAEAPKEAKEEAEPAEEAEEQAASAKAEGKVRISPLARKLAEEHGLDVGMIKGSGPDGRVIKRDILKAIESGVTPKAAPTAAPAGPAMPTSPAAQPAATGAKLEARTIPLSNMRKTIAKRLVESKTTVPHFQVSVAVNMDPLLDLRQTLNSQLESQGIKLSVNDFITRAVAIAATLHPAINSSWAGDNIQVHGTVNVGTAIALPAEKGGGLVVATCRDTHLKGLRQISSEIRGLSEKARTAGLGLDEMSDSTITISNLGMPQYGVTEFVAIINPPNAAIIAVGAAIKKPVVRNDELTIGHEMSVTLSGDHRVIDGAQAAEYLSTLRNLIENPAALLV